MSGMIRYSNLKLNKATHLLAPFRGPPDATRYAGGASLMRAGNDSTEGYSIMKPSEKIDDDGRS